MSSDNMAGRLYALRKQNQQSLQYVADSAGVSKTHIWQLEKGEIQNPTVDLLKRLSSHFRVSVGYLVGEEDDAIHDGAFKAFYREFEFELTRSDWEVLFTMARRLTGKTQESARKTNVRKNTFHELRGLFAHSKRGFGS